MNSDRQNIRRFTDCARQLSGLLCLLLIGCSHVDAHQVPDTVYYNGKVITAWPAHPVVQAVAISGDRFSAVGSNAEVLKTAGPKTNKIDLRGKCLVPGLIDSHAHPISAALSEKDGPIPVFNSIPEIQKFVRERAAKLPANQIILVPTVYSTRLAERRYPGTPRS